MACKTSYETWHYKLLIISYNIITQQTHAHTRLTALFPGLPGWAGTRKVKPIWILLKQETVSGSGISWAMCKSAPSSTTHIPTDLSITRGTKSTTFCLLQSMCTKQCNSNPINSINTGQHCDTIQSMSSNHQLSSNTKAASSNTALVHHNTN